MVLGITRRFLAVALVAALALLASCSTPSDSFNARARLAGLSESIVHGDPFDHVVYWNRASLEARAAGKRGEVLHVYFDGDGEPWHAGRPTLDPTARNPLILRLMALDTEPAVFLGRPCFNGLSETPQCNYTLWNDGRYSEPVVASLTAALGRLAKEAGADKVVLLGASGGGALAVLIADRVDNVDGIVTVAANLDTRAWLAYHEYSGMRQSLNPAVDGRRNEARHQYVFERHYSGGRDQIVPTNTVIKGLRDPKDLIVIPNYDHNCCWADIWPQILTDVAQLTEKVPAASSSSR
jgi:hypothetical protein